MRVEILVLIDFFIICPIIVNPSSKRNRSYRNDLRVYICYFKLLHSQGGWR